MSARRRVPPRPEPTLEELRALGKVSASWLRAVGIETVSELRRVGSAEAFGRVVFRFGNAASRNLLYALEGALQDRAYNSFSPAEKARLCRAAGIEEPRSVRRRSRAPR